MTKHTYCSFRSCLLLLLCTGLLAAAVLAAGCSSTKKESGTADPSASTEEIGKGGKSFFFTAELSDGSQKKYQIHTDQEMVGQALLENGLIEGEAGPYGLYVKQVCGEKADYDTDQAYWAFYIGSDYASGGVDTTPIEEGADYRLKYEKG